MRVDSGSRLARCAGLFYDDTMMRSLHGLLVALSVASAAQTGCKDRPVAAPGARPIRIAAASDLTFAFEELGKRFEQKYQGKPIFTFGSTGQLAKQIAEGAPFDLFAAANVSFVDEVIRAGACDPETKAPYARGRIVVWTPRSGTAAAPGSLAELVDPRFVKIAIANPDHAPYGKAARQALQSAGLWEALRPRIVYAENIKQTMQFAATGNAEVAIVALSLAVASKDGSHFLVDERLHQPIDQALVVCRRGAAPAGGRAFASFVNSPEGREVMKRYGFILPGETLAVTESR
jgi:molybdate transport system substrate-binding protein